LIFYPILTGSITFWYLGFNDSSWENFFDWIFVLVIIAVSGSSFGFMFGCVIDNAQAALMLNQFSIIALNFGAGLFSNLKNANFIISFLGYVSPFRFACEALIRLFLKGLPYLDITCEALDYTYKEMTIPILLGFLLMFFFLAWTVTIIKAKN
jgi:hypothetical protein